MEPNDDWSTNWSEALTRYSKRSLHHSYEAVGKNRSRILRINVDEAER